MIRMETSFRGGDPVESIIVTCCKRRGGEEVVRGVWQGKWPAKQAHKRRVASGLKEVPFVAEIEFHANSTGYLI
jgi:hypothetical protein